MPVCRPLLPTAEQVLPYLKMMDTTRQYSNNGPLTQTFERRLADHFGVAPTEVVTSANGTQALTQLLRALNAPEGSHCLMPAWTFIATPAAAVAANLIPHFVDVSPENWALDPELVRPILERHPVGAIIVVSPFGATLNYKQWERLSTETGVPVILDGAASFDELQSNNGSRCTTLPFMVSLHATKTFGIGEGAVVVCPSADMARTVRQWGTFGFAGNREALLTGTNAKLSDYASAVGLSSLDEWPLKRQQWGELSRKFATRVSEIKGIRGNPGFGDDWVSCYGLIQIEPPFTAGQVAQELERQGIQTIQWWGKGCHTHTAYQHFPRGNLPVTDHLSQQVLGLPFWVEMTDDDLNRLFDALSNIFQNSTQGTSTNV